jgi:anti-sigma B factor antagonist
MITLSRSNFNDLFALTDEQYKRFESLQVDIDFGEVEFISSATIAKLIVLAKNGKAFGFRVALTNVKPTIDEVFRITRLDRLLTIKS